MVELVRQPRRTPHGERPPLVSFLVRSNGFRPDDPIHVVFLPGVCEVMPPRVQRRDAFSAWQDPCVAR